jgi:hypothetical protein
MVREAPGATDRMIGETIFAADPCTLKADEVRDAVGEVVSMFGGHVKEMFEGKSQLSLPCVTEDFNAAESAPRCYSRM